MEKKRSLLFWLVTFGTPVLLGILMGIVFYSGNATGAFPIVWMFLPAAGVMLGQLVTEKDGDRKVPLPKKFMWTFLITTVAEVLCALLTFVIDGDTAALLGNGIFMTGSIVSLIMLFTEKKDIRKAYGLSMPKLSKGILITLLFIALYLVIAFGPAILGCVMSGTPVTAELFGISFTGIITAVTLPISLFLAFLPYFGEEYGWRYYLMPRLMKKFGGRLGVIILGVIWGLWHVPINLFFYSPETALQSIIIQVIACVCFAIFFGWAYMKTDCNIWVVTAIHFINNNLGTCFSGGDGSGNVYTWGLVALMAAFYICLLALPFIFTKAYSKESIDAFVKKMTAEPVIPAAASEAPAAPVTSSEEATQSV